MKVISIDTMRGLEKTSGISGVELMHRAGCRAAEAVREEFFRYPDRKRIVIVTGKGNNAGDGIAAALMLAQDSALPCPVIQAAFPVEQLAGEAAVFASRLTNSAVRVENAPSFRRGDLIVDALFGIGLARPVEEPFASWIQAVNDSCNPVIALDLPSGLNGNTGEVYNFCVKASVTLSFGLPKTGLFRGRGAEFCGRLKHAMLGIAPQILEQVPSEMEAFYPEEAAAFLPPLSFDAYKNSRGRLLLAAGSPAYPGAPRLALGAALRTGAGFVRLATGAAGAFPPPAVTVPDTEREVQKALLCSDAVAAGPGWGTGEKQRRLLHTLLDARLPAVLDADALTLLAKYPGEFPLTGATILTPHAGEARRLIPDLPEDRVSAAQTLACRFGCVAVLKGSRTVVASPDGKYSINASGSPALGIAGSGDVLTGVLGSLLAQGLSACDAARTGVSLHGAAGESVPMRGLRADDLPDLIRQAMAKAAPLC